MINPTGVLATMDAEIAELHAWACLSGPDSKAQDAYEEMKKARAAVAALIDASKFLMPRIISTNGADCVDKMDAAIRGIYWDRGEDAK